MNFQDHTEILLNSDNRLVTYVNKKGERSIMPLSQALDSNNQEMTKRLKYTKDILTHMLNNNAAGGGQQQPGHQAPNTAKVQMKSGSMLAAASTATAGGVPTISSTTNLNSGSASGGVPMTATVGSRRSEAGLTGVGTASNSTANQQYNMSNNHHHHHQQ